MKKQLALLSLAFVVLFGVSFSFSEAAILSPGQIQTITSLLQALGGQATGLENGEHTISGRALAAAAVAPSTMSTFCYDWIRNLKVGSRGMDVLALMKVLNKEGIIPNTFEGLSAPSEQSVFTRAVTSAVISFQKKYGIARTGIVGATTRKKLNRLYGCEPINSFVPLSSATQFRVVDKNGALEGVFFLSMYNPSSKAIRLNTYTFPSLPIGDYSFKLLAREYTRGSDGSNYFSGKLTVSESGYTIFDVVDLKTEKRGQAIVIISPDGKYVKFEIQEPDKNPIIIRTNLSSKSLSLSPVSGGGVGPYWKSKAGKYIFTAHEESASGTLGADVALNVSVNTDRKSFSIFGVPKTSLVSTDYSLDTQKDKVTRLAFAKIISRASELNNGAPFTVSSVSPSSEKGGSVQIIGTDVVYTPPGGYIGDDSFIATLSDGRGGFITSRVRVGVVNKSPTNVLSKVPLPNGNLEVVFYGIPNSTYTVEVSTDKVTWVPAGIVVANSNGRITFEDTGSGTAERFYHLEYVETPTGSSGTSNSFDSLGIPSGAPDSPTNVSVNRPLIGAIRWDAWNSGATNWGTTNAGLWGETALKPAKWSYRLPFFSTVSATGTVLIRLNSQGKMDQEIAYAKGGGLDYWAFDYYGSTGHPLNKGLDLYMTSTRKNDIRFALILTEYGFTNNWPTSVVNYLKDSQYQTVLNGRPVVYVFENNPTITKSSFDSLRTAAQSAGLPNPYIVWLSQDAKATQVATLGLDAVSTYASHPTGTIDQQVPYSNLSSVDTQYSNTAKSGNMKLVPIVTTGWDPRPMWETPPSWGLPAHSPYTAGTPSEIASNLQSSMQWVSSNPSTAEANTILMYAWNEIAEGCWLVPLRESGSERLDAIRQVISPTASDVMPPVISIASPATYATLSGGVAISALAFDNVGVSKVQFKVDGANVGAEDTAAPFTVAWNTSSVANGSHMLSAVAFDTAGNTATSVNVSVTVDNSTSNLPPYFKGVITGPTSLQTGTLGTWEFSGGDPDGTSITYSADWGDGTAVSSAQATVWPSISNSFSLSHTYQTVGTYTITFTLTDAQGLSTSVTRSIQVSAAPNLPQSSVTVSVQSPSQIFVQSGVSQQSFAMYDLHASAEKDLRVTAMTLPLTVGGGAQATDLTNCRLFDGATMLNTGSNQVNPFSSGGAQSTHRFNFSGVDLPISKGTDKQLILKCDVSVSAAHGSTHNWGISNLPDPQKTIEVTTTDGSAVLATISSSAGPTITVSTKPPFFKGITTGPTTIQTGTEGTWSFSGGDPDGTSITYSADWGDGTAVSSAQATVWPSISNSFSLSHTYQAAGTYTITFTLIDAQGLGASITKAVEVTTPTALINPYSPMAAVIRALKGLFK